jgi:hypothetical protein
MANFAGRIFNRKQALEREIKDGFAKLSFTQATAVLDLTADITLTSVGSSVARNGSTFTIQVLAAAANPTDTVLVAFTGTSAAITCTVTPNDGTNNGATPVDLTTAELRELISTGAVVGKTVTLTDASSLRALQTATGGGAAALAEAGEGDGVVATFASGAITIDSGVGISSVAQNSAGDYTITLSDAYASLKSVKATVLKSSALDIRFQLHSETVSSTKTIRIMSLTSATKTDIPSSTSVLIKFEFKNAQGF